MSGPFPIVQALTPILAGAVFWILYFDLKDSLRKEPRLLLLAGFLLGVAATGLAFLAYELAPLLGLPERPAGTPSQLFWYCLGVVGPIEEGAKFIVAALVLFRMRHFDEPIDGLVYSSTVAIGFASTENLLYAPSLPFVQQLARAATSPLVHSLFSALWGFGAGHALLVMRRDWRRHLLMVLTVAAGMFFHGLYDALLLTVDYPIVASLVAAGLWVFVIVHARRVVRARVIA